MNKRIALSIPLLSLLFLSLSVSVSGQDVYQHVSSKEIYGFLDEMASERIIELNSAIKPYSQGFHCKTTGDHFESPGGVEQASGEGTGILPEGFQQGADAG